MKKKHDRSVPKPVTNFWLAAGAVINAVRLIVELIHRP
jgi:hypothetical protein